jgi:voltage-gated potassium channel
MWWGIVTLTTVGYGDMYPITSLGKICAAVIAVLNVGLFALPTGILAAGFAEAIRKPGGVATGSTTDICPHCGARLPAKETAHDPVVD